MLPFSVLTATLIGPFTEIVDPLRKSFFIDNRGRVVNPIELSVITLELTSAKYTSPNAPEPITLPNIRQNREYIILTGGIST